MEILQVSNPSDPDWLEMRVQLWPDSDWKEDRAELEGLVADTVRFVAFIARIPDGRGIGFAEVALRRDYVNGCESSPVAFLEGVYVRPEFRRQGVARLLCEAAELWGQSKGCKELASDAAIDNTVSHQMHRNLGFQETERVVYFRKILKTNWSVGAR